MLRGREATGVIAFAERWMAGCAEGLACGGCSGEAGAGEFVAQPAVRREKTRTYAERRMVLGYSKKKAPHGREPQGAGGAMKLLT
jgi:hypothetical protein